MSEIIVVTQAPNPIIQVSTPGPIGPAGAAGAAGVGVPAGGTTGQVLSKIDGTNYNTQWSSAGGYSAPTLGSTTIASGTTYANVAGLTINSTTIPTSATLAKTADKLSVFAATTSAEFASVISDEIGTGNVQLSDLATNAQVASYTLVLADRGKLVEMNNGSANNLTVPLNATVAYPTGTQINILQTGAGQTTVVATGGVTINATPGLKLRAQWSSATLIKRATDTWVLVGDLSA